MPHQLHPLLAENPTIQNVIAEETAKEVAKRVAEYKERMVTAEEIVEQIDKRVAKETAQKVAEALRKAIQELLRTGFSMRLSTRVQQTLKHAEDPEQLKKFLCRIVRVSDEQEVHALLTEYFPAEVKMLEDEIKSRREVISVVVEVRFSAQIHAQVQQTIASIEDVELLRELYRKIISLSNDEEVSSMLKNCFSVPKSRPPLKD